MATLKDRFINSLLGVPVQTQSVAPSVSYGENIDNYLNTLGEQPYMKALLNQPKETGLTLDQYKEGVANGLNYGIPEIAKAQQELGINIPKTGEEIYKAQLGEFNQPTQLNVGTSNDLRKGGLIPDIASGFRENYAQGFNANNLVPQNKGFATRLGEGLGTIGRFADSPLGRGLIAYGLSNAVGDTNPLEQAITAGVGRQGNLTRDKAYRQSLINMGVDEAQVNAIPGIMSDDVYKNLINALNTQEMRKYREAYLTNQQEQNKIMNQFRQDQLKTQESERAFKNMIEGKKLSLDEQKLALEWYKANNPKETAADRKEKAQMKQAQNTINMISKAKDTVQKNPNAFGYVQGALGADVSNRLFKGGTQARSTINSVAAEYRKYLTGAQMSDRERLDYEKFLPSPKDNAKIINDKLNAMLDVISAREGIETTGNGITNVGNYKVRVKQ